MRGNKQYGPNIDSVITYLHGRIERDIEQVCLTTGIPLSVISARISELLHPMGTQRPQSEVPLLRSPAPRLSAAVATLEVVEHSHHHAPSPDGSAEVQDHRGEEVKSGKSKIRQYWAQFTPEERSKMMRKRMTKWSPDAQAKWGKKVRAAAAKIAKTAAAKKDAERKAKDAERHRVLRAAKKKATEAKGRAAGRTAKPKLNAEERHLKQRVYVARNALRKQGVSEAEINAQFPLPAKLDAAAAVN